MFQISAILVLSIFHPTEERIVREKRSSHIPPSWVKTFQRGSVESIPIQEISAYTSIFDYGTRSLPLRAAIETVPDIIENSQRLPLRDAVEKRPAPDEAFDPEIDVELEIQNTLNPSTYDFVKQNPYHVVQSYFTPQGYVSSFGAPVIYGPNIHQRYVLQTPHQPFQRFHAIVGDYINAPPYRSDNVFQQLIKNPSFRSSRSLYPSNPFLKNIEHDRNGKVKFL